MRTNEAITGAILIALALAMIAYTTTFASFPGQKYGPALFPRLLGLGIIVCGGLLVVRGLLAYRAGGSHVELAAWSRDPRRVFSFLLVIGVILFYIFFSEPIGFLPVAFGSMLVLFVWFQVRWVVAIPTAAASVWIVHWFFSSLMRVPLPRGLLTNIL